MASRHDQTDIQILIIGGGIAGLAAATALSQKFHNVTVLESKPGLNEFGASIGITSNGVRPLKAWGLESAFEKVVTKNGFLDIREGATNRMIGHIPHNKNQASKLNYGEEIWNVNRQDFQQVLARAAEGSGAEIVFDAGVEGIDVDAGVLWLKDGREVKADLIVGADGIAPSVRRFIPKLKNIEPVSRGSGSFRCTVPKDKIQGNEKLEWLLQTGDQYCWLEAGNTVLSWPLPEHRPYDVVVGPVSCEDVPAGRWGIKGDRDIARSIAEDYCPEIRELLEHLDVCVKWKQAEMPPLETCRSESGKVVLIGDAWHAMLPHAASGGNSAVEDAACLAECIDWAFHNNHDINTATRVFEEIRTPRVQRMQAACHEGVEFLQTKDPEIIAVRDHMMAAATKAYDEDLALPDDVRRTRAKETPDMNAKFPTEPYLQWLYGYDAISVAKEHLARL